MGLLRTLTVVSAGVLAVTLVVGLVVVIVFLASVARHLGAARRSLASVAEGTRQLGGAIERLHAGARAAAAALAEAEASLGRAHDQLSPAGEPDDVAGSRGR